MARLFLSYRHLDEDAARKVEAALAADGHDTFMDRLPGDDGIAVGEDWEARLYDELHRSDAVIAMVSAAYTGSQWCFAELAIARARGVTIFPVMLEQNIQHPLLTSVQHVDASARLEDALAQLVPRLRSLDAPGGRGWNEDRPIYRGLEPYEIEDASVFFGRSAEVSDLVKRASTPTARSELRPLLVVGPSGSGKSSVVRAGLMPALARRDEWLVLPAFAPGEAPLRAFAFQLAKWQRRTGGAADLGAIQQQLRDDAPTFLANLVLALKPSATRVLLVVDQFEELASRTPLPDAQAFLAWMETTIASPLVAVAAVGTLRSDGVSRIQELWGRPSQFVVPYLLAPLGRAQLSEVITGPARVAGIHVPDALVATLVDETADGLALPFLSFVLRELATDKHRGDALSADRYRELGGVRHALAQQADQALQEAVAGTGMTEDVVIRALTGLVTVDDEGRPVRRRRLQSSFADDLRAPFDAFVSRRLLTSRVEGDAVVIDVAHEAFFQSWPPLVDAIRTVKADLELRRDLSRDAAAWTRADRAPRYLWSGERARAVPQVDGLSPEEQEFLKAATDAAVEADEARADGIASQVLSAERPKEQPEMALALGTAIAQEIALTPRVVRCLYDALLWHAVEELVAEFDIPGLQAAALAETLDVFAVSTNVAYQPPPRPTTRVSPGRVNEPARPAVRLTVGKWDGASRTDAWSVGVEGTEVRRLLTAADRVLVCTDAGTTHFAVATGDVLQRDTEIVDIRAVAPDGSRIAVVAQTELEVRETQTGKLLRAFAAGEIRNVRFSDDGGHVAWITGSGVAEGDIASGRRVGQAGDADVMWPARRSFVASLPREQRNWTHAVVQDHALLWNRDRAALWRIRHPGSILTFTTPTPSAQPLPSSPTVAQPQARAIWLGPPTRTLLENPLRIASPGVPDLLLADGEHRSFRAAAFSENGKWLAGCGRTYIDVYDATSGALVARFGEHDDEEGDTYCAVAVSDDGAVTVSGSLAGNRSFAWDTRTGAKVRKVGGNRVAIDPAGTFVLAGLHNDAWVTTLNSEDEPTPVPFGVLPVSSPPNGESPASGDGQQIAAWNPGSFESHLADLAVAPDGTLGAVASSRWTLVCALPSGEPLFAWDMAAVGVDFIGTTLAVIREDGRSSLVTLPTPEEILKRAMARVRDEPTSEERAAYGLDPVSR